jgi:hypothetical protein
MDRAALSVQPVMPRNRRPGAGGLFFLEDSLSLESYLAYRFSVEGSFAMANIVVAATNWVSVGNATDLQPGASQGWMWGLGNKNEAITITAHALAAFNTASIIVENLQISEGSRGHIAFFNVRNVGSSPIQQYNLTGSFISQ